MAESTTTPEEAQEPTPEEAMALLTQAHAAFEDALQALGVAAAFIPGFRLSLRTMQQLSPQMGAQAEAALAICDVLEIAAKRLVAIGKIAERHGLVVLPS